MFQDHKVAYARKHIKIKEAKRLSFLRQSIAYMLSRSARQVPHASMVTRFDVTTIRDNVTCANPLFHLGT